MTNIPYPPNFPHGNEREQLTQLRSYLHQLVDQLNWALNQLEKQLKEQKEGG